MHSSPLNDLINISSFIGNHSSYVQGAGGNTSVKIDTSLMAIKASGHLLKDMSLNSGYVIVNYKDIRENLLKKNLSEEETTNIINTAVLPQTTESRPSMETGFHALLNERYVVHSHSVYSNILTCCTEGEKLISQLFPNSIWIEYANPGKELIEKFTTIVNSQRGTNLIFLQNHGIVVTGNNLEEVSHHHNFITNRICQHFGISFTPHIELEDENELINENILFPDQVIYILDDRLKKTLAAREIISAFNFIFKKIQELGLTPNFISKQKIDILINMESEKYRKSLVK